MPPDTLFAHAERAFIGTLLARDGDRMTFDVAEAFGGELPDPLVVRDDLPLPWRVSAPPDTEIGLVVYERNGELLVNPCTVVPPASLRDALPPGTVRPAPPPPPDPVPPAPPEPLLRPLQQRLATTDASASVRAGCQGRCAGTLTLRGRGGELLGRGRVDLAARTGTLAVRLTTAARRRVARHGRLAVRLVVRLEPALRPVVHRLRLVRRHG